MGVAMLRGKSTWNLTVLVWKEVSWVDVPPIWIGIWCHNSFYLKFPQESLSWKLRTSSNSIKRKYVSPSLFERFLSCELYPMLGCVCVCKTFLLKCDMSQIYCEDFLLCTVSYNVTNLTRNPGWLVTREISHKERRLWKQIQDKSVYIRAINSIKFIIHELFLILDVD